MNKDYLRLNVKEEDPIKTIEREYKRLAKEVHPDKGGNKEDFQKLKASYDSIMKIKKEKKCISFNDSYLQRDYINLAFSNRFKRIDKLKNM